jgi:DNA-binding MarR family transcriptional regulator
MNKDETVFDADDDLMLWWLILQTRSLMYKARSIELQEYMTTPAESQLLWVVKGLDHPPTETEISRWLLREPHAISSILKRMEKKGLAIREKDPERRNITRVRMTEKALELYPLLAKREVVHEIMSVVSDDERRQMRPVLKRIRDKAIESIQRQRIPQRAPYSLIG